jgi:hypothetical protein
MNPNVAIQKTFAMLFRAHSKQSATGSAWMEKSLKFCFSLLVIK